MRGRSRLTRVVCQLIAAGQLLLPGATSWADARLEREVLTLRGASHVEDVRSPQCPRAHADDCALCQHLNRPLARAAPPAVLPPFEYGSHVPPAGPSRPPRTVALLLPQPRAPPHS